MATPHDSRSAGPAPSLEDSNERRGIQRPETTPTARRSSSQARRDRAKRLRQASAFPRLSSLTTVQLARAIADAVLRTSRQRHRDSVLDAPTQAVLDTLHRTGTGFLAETPDEDGIGRAETVRKLK